LDLYFPNQVCLYFSILKTLVSYRKDYGFHFKQLHVGYVIVRTMVFTSSNYTLDTLS